MPILNQKNTPGLTSFYHQGVKLTNGSIILNLFSQGNQLKRKVANLKFSKKNGDGRYFLLVGWGFIIAGKD